MYDIGIIVKRMREIRKSHKSRKNLLSSALSVHLNKVHKGLNPNYVSEQNLPIKKLKEHVRKVKRRSYISLFNLMHKDKKVTNQQERVCSALAKRNSVRELLENLYIDIDKKIDLINKSSNGLRKIQGKYSKLQKEFKACALRIKHNH